MKVIIATNNIDKTDSRFNDECLKDIATNSKNIPIFLDFNHCATVGKMLGCEYVAGNLIANLEFDNFQFNGFYAVPSYTVYEQVVIDGILVDEKVKLFALGLTRTPADENVTPLDICQ